MPDAMTEWARSASLAWYAGEGGEFDKAIRCYRYCDEIAAQVGPMTEVFMNPDLSILRHKQGVTQGYMRSVPPNEDMVVTLELPGLSEEAMDAQGMSSPTFSGRSLEASIRAFTYQPEDYHKKNIKKEFPHLMVLSTGRCGTVSLYRLLEKTHYLPYHSFFYLVPTDVRHEMMCRFLSGNFNNKMPMDFWTKTRAAEWLGAINQGRPMAGLNHLDTVFAPVFAQIHPKAKFIYLHRNPEKVFESFYSKMQWGDHQLTPLLYKFTPEFHWRRSRYDLPTTIAWFIRFTEEFSRAFGRVYPDRFIEIQSEDLFTQEKDTINQLVDFTEIQLDPTEHFKTVYNEKVHKKVLSQDQINNGLEVFRREYGRLL